MVRRIVQKKVAENMSLKELIEESRKLSDEEHMERCRRAIEGSLRRSGALKGKKRFL